MVRPLVDEFAEKTIQKGTLVQVAEDALHLESRDMWLSGGSLKREAFLRTHILSLYHGLRGRV